CGAARRGGGDGNGRRQIIHDREGDGGRRRAVPGSVPGLGDDGVQRVGKRPTVPVQRVGRGDDLGTHGSATEIELHSHYTHVIGGRSAQSHFPRHRAAGRGAGHGNGRRLRVVEDGEGDRGGRGRVAGGVPRPRRHRVRAVGELCRVQAHGVWSRRILGAQRGAVEVALY